MENTDRVLITSAKAGDIRAERTLWDRYQNLIHKNYHIMERQLNHSPQVREERDDFYSDSYIAFRKAVKAIDLEKIRDDKWKFLGYFRFYMMNLRNDTINRVIKQYRRERPMTIATESDQELDRSDRLVAHQESSDETSTEAILNRITEEQAVKTCFQKWDDRRKTIFNKKREGLSNTEIAKKLEVNPATITYYLQSMKKDFEEALY